MAADGFRRLLTAVRNRQKNAENNPREFLLATGLGYIDFARSTPALFRLMFAEEHLYEVTEELAEARQIAFLHLASDVEKFTSISPFDDPAGMERVTAVWCFMHGFAELLISGRMQHVQALSVADQEAYFQRAFEPLLA